MLELGTLCLLRRCTSLPECNGRIAQVVGFALDDPHGCDHVLDAPWIAESLGRCELHAARENLIPIAPPTRIDAGTTPDFAMAPR